MTRKDRKALRRAIEAVRRESTMRARQIADKLASEPWEDVGEFASYSAQCRALRLRPWQFPPCWIDDIPAALNDPELHRGLRTAAELLQRMLAAGLSRYEPYPLKALAEADRDEAEAEADPQPAA